MNLKLRVSSKTCMSVNLPIAVHFLVTRIVYGIRLDKDFSLKHNISSANLLKVLFKGRL